MAAVLLLSALVPATSAASVEPTKVPADKRVKSCTHFEPSEGAWTELRANPARNGDYVDGHLKITISNYDGKTFDWEANRSVVEAVYVRGGNNDQSFLYEYTPPSDGDTNLTTPREHYNEIQYVSFCYGDQVPPEEEPCPTVTATAEAGPSNHLEWTSVDDADTYKIYRAVGAGSFSLLATVDNETLAHDDGDVEQGETYRYKVTAVIDGQETRACNIAEVTAIPVFPTALAATSAALLGVGAYAVIKRRS